MPTQPPPGLSVVEAFNLAAAIASIVLAVVAIGLSIFFWMKGKDTETRVATALEGIRSQTDALQKLTGRWMDRFTRYATEPKPADRDADRPDSARPRNPCPARWGSASAAVSGCGSAHRPSDRLRNYSVLLRRRREPLGPGLRADEPTDVVKNVLQWTYTDYMFIDRALNGADQQRVEQSPLYNLYQHALNARGRVMTADMVIASRG